MLSLDGDRQAKPLLRTEFNEAQASISPDVRWLSYTSDESGHPEVYVQRFRSAGGRWRISTAGGGDAMAGRRPRAVLHCQRLKTDGRPVDVGATFEHGPPVPPFDTGMSPHWGEARNHYDISRDGRRFLFMVPVADDRLAPFTVVVNWVAELRK